jgi:hypothetical protein
MTVSDLTSAANNTAGVSFSSTPSLICNDIVFDSCVFAGTVWGAKTDQQVQGVAFTNSKFNILYKGIVLGTAAPSLTGPTGVRITSNVFNKIWAEGIVLGAYASLNASGHNIFYDVGNHFTGSFGTPATSIILIQNSNNVSIGDLFERTNAFATTYVRIKLDDTSPAYRASVSQTALAVGNYIRQNGSSIVLRDDDTDTVTTVSTNQATAFALNYSIIRDTLYRTGTL